jgi:hypothetical protein
VIVKALRTLVVAVLALAWGPPGSAQNPPPGVTNATMRISEARTANAALMRQYSWTSRTEVTDQGQLKDLRIDTVNYGPDGKLQRSTMNDQSAPLPFGFLRRRIAEAERQKVEEYLSGLRGLVEEYTLPTAGKVQAFMNRATATGPDASGLFQVTGQSVVVPGDTFSLWVDPTSRQPRKVQVSTTFQGDPVSLVGTFKTLPSGLNHVAYAEAIVPAKQLTVQVQNFDYNRNN